MKRSKIYKPLRDQAIKGMPYLKFRDLQKKQMHNPRQNYPIPLPALFIEISDIRFSDLLEHHQKGEATIGIYLYMDIVTDSFDGAELENETIELLDHMDDVFQTFEGFCVPGMTPLVRQTEYKPQYGERYIIFRVDFSTTIDSHKMMSNQTVSKPDPDINSKYKF
ncbi:hypothetical protein [Dysgonomonas sp. 520]|uniref:hypothetical protein n=1 Tax=Dysgonomonas sp. 520 TaxID=2302931 RepID=UPI0013D5D4B7|nr:hypothetical protein [Dysgonomonas sp. 520]NDW10457.1 hypothetical protein [Dysgonomonas sp. 520]